MPPDGRWHMKLLTRGALLVVFLVGSALSARAGVQLSHTVSGSTVSLSWTALAGVASYRLEAGTAPGLSNAAVLPLATQGYVATGVPNGVYYVRVVALGSAGAVLAVSNEATVTVGPPACLAAPAAPAQFSHTVSGSTVMMRWQPATSGCPSTGFLITAGFGSGEGNLAQLPVAGTSTAVLAPNGRYFVRVFATNDYGTSSASNETIITVGPEPVAFGAGRHLVGTGIRAGRYFADPRSGCYWERQRGLRGSLDDIIANEFVGYDALQWVVDIAASDVAFSADADCGNWFATPRAGTQPSIRAGVWLVGSQLAPGIYQTQAGPGCYWERRRDFSGELDGIIDNEFSSAASVQTVSIAATDAGFLSDADCGTWVRVSPDDARVLSPQRLPARINAAREEQQAQERSRRQ